MSRNAIADALWALSANTVWMTDRTFVTRERKLRLFSDVPKMEQAYLCQVSHGDLYGKTSNTPYKRVLRFTWIGYFDAQNSDDPSSEMDAILDALEAKFAPVPQDPGFFDSRNTLLGLCYSCFIDGEAFKDPGDIDGQAMFTVPIKVLVP